MLATVLSASFHLSFLVLAAGLTADEQASVEEWLSIIGMLLFVLIAGLLGFAIAIRYIAGHSTRPCPFCMEFISKRKAICPRCGKNVAPVKF